MRFRKLISGTCRVDTGEWLDSDEDSAWYANLREAVQRCRELTSLNEAFMGVASSFPAGT